MDILKPVGKYVIIHSKGKEERKNIIVPKFGTYRDHRQWIDKNNEVYAVGDEVTKVKVGDMVVFDSHTPLERADKLTEIMEESLGFKAKAEIKDKDGRVISEEETEKYFAIEEKYIIAVIN